MGVDPRPVLRAAYAAFQEGSKPERILAAADPMKGSRDTFYANLVRTAGGHGLVRFCLVQVWTCTATAS